MTSVFEKDYPVFHFLCDERGFLRPSYLLGYMVEHAIGHEKNVFEKSLEVMKMLHSWQVHFLLPIQKESTLRLRTWISEAKGFFIKREFDGFDENGEMVFFATSRWLFLDPEKRRPVRIPKDMIAFFPMREQSYFSKSLYFPKDLEKEKCMEFQVENNDIDENFHMNNAAYLSHVLKNYPKEWYEKKELRILGIEYRKESLFGETLEVKRSIMDDDEYLFVEQSGENRVEMKFQWRERKE